MSTVFLFDLAALIALVPAALRVWRGPPGRGALFWLLLAVALAGVLVPIRPLLGGVWDASLSTAIWATVFAVLLLFAGLAAISAAGARLAPVLLPYLILLGAFAVIGRLGPARLAAEGGPGGWLALHIALSVATYGLVTLAALAGLAVTLQERALKGKRPGALSQRLPAVADGETLRRSLLWASETVLGIGILTGMGLEYPVSGEILAFDHKTLFALLAFVAIGALLIADRIGAVRGRRAARLVLIAWLLLTLAYPGVKFVADFLVG
ncbi:MAG: cytochrome C assembly family protein [Alphaproteobacteria bacterium]